MEDEGTSWLTKVAVAFGILFFAACFQSCSDLVYRIKGKQANGVVTKVVESSGRRRTTYAVYYSFTNENRTEKKRVNGNDPISESELGEFYEGKEVPVEYYGDEMFQSRIAGRTSWWAPLFLIGSCVGLIGTVVVLSITSRPKKKSPPPKKPMRR